MSGKASYNSPLGPREPINITGKTKYNSPLGPKETPNNGPPNNNGKVGYNSPIGPKEPANTTGSNFNGFARPLGQFSPRQSSSPYNTSPNVAQDGEFIPLGYSSPIKHPNQRGRGDWKGSRRSSYSPAHSTFNSSCSPYNANKSQRFSGNRRSRGGFGNSCTDDISLYYNRSMLEDPWASLEGKLKNLSNKGATGNRMLTDTDSAGECQENENSMSSGEDT